LKEGVQFSITKWDNWENGTHTSEYLKLTKKIAKKYYADSLLLLKKKVGFKDRNVKLII